MERKREPGKGGTEYLHHFRKRKEKAWSQQPKGHKKLEESRGQKLNSRNDARDQKERAE